MRKRRQPEAQEKPVFPEWPDLETIDGYEKFRQELIDEAINALELHHTAKFYAQHTSAEFTEWFFHQYYHALGIPFDSNTAKRARDNVLQLAHKLHEFHQRKVKAMENADA